MLGRTLLGFAIGAVVVAASGAAYAGGRSVKAPVAVGAPHNWTGFYAGINAGGVWGSSDPGLSIGPDTLYGTAVAAAAFTGATPKFNNSGFTGGIQGGYNWQNGHTVVGIEADFEYFGPKGSNAGSGFIPATSNFTSVQDFSADWLVTVRPRAGIIVNDNLLIYGTAGLAITNFKYSETVVGTAGAGPFGEAFSRNGPKAGFVVGVGAEYALNNHWSLRAEYLYLNFGSTKGVAQLTFPTIPGSSTQFNYDIKLQENIARVALNYKFGGM